MLILCLEHRRNKVTENIKIGYCSTCKWRYELQVSVGCDNPSPERIKWAEHPHHGDCKIWQLKEKV
jgi:hypothetical protein